MPAYLDHAATTPMRPEAIDAMMPFLADTFGNPSASHRWGREARRALDDARDTMANVLGAQPGEVVFTSGGTEADNQAIVGVLARTGGIAVCSAIEHHAVLEPVERSGGRVVAVGPDGRIDLGGLADALDEDVAVVSIMLVNNEVGVIQPFDEIAALVRQRAPRAVLHTDAVQAFTWLDVASVAADADLISVSAHKFGGPKGVGAFVIRDGTSIDPLLFGGGQERERRSGTQNVAGVVAMAAAARRAADERASLVARLAPLRDRLLDGLLDAVPDTVETGVTGIHADRDHKVAGSCHVCFGHVESETLLFLLDQAGLAASAASSCTSGAMEPSHVLAAMGINRTLAGGSLRLSFGWPTTAADVDLALDVVPASVRRVRGEDGLAHSTHDHLAAR